MAEDDDRSGAEMLRIVVLEGDETGQELLEQSLRVLDERVTKVPVEFEHYDLSLGNRRKTSNEVVARAAEAMREAGAKPELESSLARDLERLPEIEPRYRRLNAEEPTGSSSPACARSSSTPAAASRAGGRTSPAVTT